MLARSATGQDMSVYTTFSTGPRRPDDPDGPDEYHVVLLDNGRSEMLGSGFQDMLRCIRCGACMNHCPVYQAVGGHAYGWVYPGPIGAVLTPKLVGVDQAGDLPNASTFCGRCEAVCPMRIPLPKMMRYWRDREFERHLSPATMRYGLGFWAFFARHPRLYRFATRIAARALANRAADRGRFTSLPLAGGWTVPPRPPGPGRPHLHGAVGQAEEPGMSAREAVLGKIRRSLHVDDNDSGRRAAVVARLDSAPRSVIPQRGQLPKEERIALFTAMAEKVSATVARVAADDDVPAAIADFLRDHNLPASVRMGDDTLIAGLPWERTQVEIKRGPSDGNDPVGLSHAAAGVAETGTLVLLSGADNPTTLNFLPETHIVVVRADDIAGDYESVWDAVRAKYGKGVMPRTVNMVTGPSRSADIEQKLLLGAHGPRRLHIVVLG